MSNGRQISTLKTKSHIVSTDVVMPNLVAAAGEPAARRFLEFFAAQIRNKNTRTAYYRAVVRFFDWCDQNGIGLHDIEPLHIAAYIELLDRDFSKPTAKQHLAAIRMLFDWLVTGQIVASNPATSVRGPKHVVKRGKTPVLSAEEARELLDSIPVQDQNGSPDLVGLRDRALIGLMTFSFARVSAACAMNVEDYFSQGKRWWIRLNEKGGKVHDLPAHHSLEEYLDAYIEAAGITGRAAEPLFRTAQGKTGRLTDNRMHRNDVLRMVRRRALSAGMDAKATCHTFRATGITAYLDNGGLLEHAQNIANHSSPKTTKLYDRTGDEVTLDEIEKIQI